jgi:hypothetical protein
MMSGQIVKLQKEGEHWSYQEVEKKQGRRRHSDGEQRFKMTERLKQVKW